MHGHMKGQEAGPILENRLQPGTGSIGLRQKKSPQKHAGSCIYDFKRFILHNLDEETPEFGI